MPATKIRRFDLAAAAPLIVWLVFVAMASLSHALQRFSSERLSVAAVADLTSAGFAVLLVAMIVIRRPPVRKKQGLAPQLAGFAGFLAPLGLELAPRAEVSQSMHDLSSALVLLGTLGALTALMWLGRCFSVLPQARGLVTGGPYRWIRHPLYLAEIAIAAGIALQCALPWSLAALVVVVTSQIPRIHFEEDVLAEAFPAYRDYARRTARLVPGLY